jgi:hypothetical protein
MDALGRFIEHLRPLPLDNFKPDTERVTSYLQLDRSNPNSSNKVWNIPIGKSETMPFINTHGGWQTDRSLNSYDNMLFHDEFVDTPPVTENWSVANMLRPSARRTETTQVIAGGRDGAFAKGKNVLDIASGEALALLQYAELYPETSFIGIDIGYAVERRFKPNYPGVQLSKDSWNVLHTIPDHSIDTVLSSQGVMMWGVPRENGPYGNDQLHVIEEFMRALNRVTKSGALFRYDGHEEEKIVNLFNKYGWDVKIFADSTYATTVAIKNRSTVPVSPT